MQVEVQFERICRKNIFRKKQRTRKVPPNTFGGFKEREKALLIFWMPNDSVKRMCYVVTGYKQNNKVSFVYLEYKSQESYD